MIVKETQMAWLAEAARRHLAQRGVPPEGAAVEAAVAELTKETQPGQPLFAPPPAEPGTVSRPADWQRAWERLSTDLAVAEEAAAKLAGREKGTQEAIEGMVARLAGLVEEARRMIDEQGNAFYTESFADLTQTEAPVADEARNIPACSAHVDLRRHLASVPLNEEQSRRVDAASSEAVWWLSPQAEATQLGRLEEIGREGGSFWGLAVPRAPLPLTLTLRVRLSGVANHLGIDTVGRYEQIRVLVNGQAAQKVDKKGSLWAFPEQLVQSVEVQLTKNAADDAQEDSCYFVVQGISLVCRRYREEGVFVSRPLALAGSSFKLTVGQYLPPQTEAHYYFGTEEDGRFRWRRCTPGVWQELGGNMVATGYLLREGPGFGEEVYPGIWSLGTLPVTDAAQLQLDVGDGMWEVRSIPDPGGDLGLELWPLGAGDREGCLANERSLPLTAGRLYRLSTFVRCPRAAVVRDWQPLAVGCELVDYNNYIRQQQRDLVLQEGINRVELIVRPTGAGAYLAPNLYVRDVASEQFALAQSAVPVSLYALRNSYPPGQLDVYALENGLLLVNYNPLSAGDVRYRYRYYTYGEGKSGRVMVVMRTADPAASPLISGLSIHWR